MKKLKSLLCAAMVLVLAVTLAVPAFAAETGTGTITIQNAVPGANYQAYKIFDLVQNGNSYAYTPANGWEGFFALKQDGQPEAAPYNGAQWFTIDPVNKVVTWKNQNQIVNGKVPAEDMKPFTDAAKAYIKAQSNLEHKDVTAEGTPGTPVSATISGVSNGYYLITTTTGALCAVDSAVPNVTVTEKNPAPVIKKAGEKQTAAVDDMVWFAIPVVRGAMGAGDYVITDTMTGLQVGENPFTVTVYRANGSTDANAVRAAIENGTIRVAQDGSVTVTDQNGEYDFTDTNSFRKIPADGWNITQTKNENSIVVTIPGAKMDTDLKENDVILLTCQAKMTVAGTAQNEVQMKYGAIPTPKPAPVKVANFAFELYKFAKQENGADLLLNAEFYMFTEKAAADRLAGDPADTASQAQAMKFTFDNKETYTVSGNGAAALIQTGNSGRKTIQGLADGTYYLVETKAPDGYNRLTKPVKIVITAGNPVFGDQGLNPYSVTVDMNADDKVEGTQVALTNSGIPQVKVENKSGAELPSTGGIGTTVFYVVGGLIMAAALVMFLTKKRMGE